MGRHEAFDLSDAQVLQHRDLHMPIKQQEGAELPLQIELLRGQAHDATLAELLLQDLPAGTILLAERGDDADCISAAPR